VIREAVEEFGPRMGKDFWEKRMITPAMQLQEQEANHMSLRPRYSSYKRGEAHQILTMQSSNLPFTHPGNSSSNLVGQGDVSWEDLVDWENA